MKALKKILLPSLWIVIVYWPVSFLVYSLKWDNLDVILPFRYFASQCFENGIFPLWNPYTALGYPVYADLQSPTFFPEVWITSIMGGYTNYTLHFWFVAYLIIGFLGFRRWLSSRGIGPYVSTGYALMYALSGFFVGHGQVIFATVAGAFIPWILYFYNTYRQTARSIHLVGIFFFAFLLITGGYPTLTLQLGYFMVFMGLFQWLFQNQIPSKKSIVNLGVTAIIILISTAFIWEGLYDGIQHVNRLSGLEDKYVFQNPFSLWSHVSFIFPAATLHGDFWGTDISMRNAYIGLFPLMIIFFNIKTLWKNRRGELFVGALFWLLALGDQTPIQPFLAKILPGLDLFRFPAYYIFWLCILMLAWAAESHANVLKTAQIRSMAIISAVIGAVGLIYGVVNASWNKPSGNGFYAFSESLNTPELLAISGAIYLLTAILVGLAPRRWNAAQMILWISVFHLSFFVQTQHERTVVNPREPSAIHALFDEIPDGFPPPAMRPLTENKDSKMSHFPAIWRNTSIFRKQPSEDAFSSFWLASFDQWQSDSTLRKKVLARELAYTSSGNGVTIQVFEPSRMRFAVRGGDRDTLFLTQSYFPYWSASVEEKVTEVYIDKKNFMKVPIPEGDTRVEFTFDRPRISLYFYIGTALWLVAGIVLVIFSFRIRPYRDI